VSLVPLHDPHHDGSDLYVPEAPVELGDTVTVRLRVPSEAGVDSVAVRYVTDGDPLVARAEVDEQDDGETWWRASFVVRNPATPYRWLLSGGRVGYAWLTGDGLVGHDVPDTDDFVCATGEDGPAWHREGVVYQVFTDRFARAGEVNGAPDWAVPRSWDELPSGRGPETPREWFGGDLPGVEARLEHLVGLGVTILYLTPFFPARSTHRYDASSFDRVDPLLGGDDALVSLVREAHARGIRVLGDLTINHVGDAHEWFERARGDLDAPERPFFLFDERLEHGYEAWYGIRTLPKLDHRAKELESRLFDGAEAVAQRWLRPPYDLDGWRLDVANMAGRSGDVDLTRDVARAVRRAALEARSDAVLVAEHSHDARPDLQGDGWHGTMAYMGFTRPMWCWLRGDVVPAELQHRFLGLPVEVPRLGGQAVTATMRRFRAGIPWRSVIHSWLLLDSHDIARFRVVAGSRERHIVGIGLQMTTPGVPMVFAGDELGLEGSWGEDARRTMPWDRPETWDRELLLAYRTLIGLRRSSAAFAHGGMRYAHVREDAIAYLRETRDDRMLCLAVRASTEEIELPLSRLRCTALEPVLGGEARIEKDTAVLPGDGPAFHVWRLRDG
jgi:alpha-glucosidase